jgi:hypothetical protein
MENRKEVFEEVMSQKELSYEQTKEYFEKGNCWDCGSYTSIYECCEEHLFTVCKNCADKRHKNDGK